MEYHKMFDSFPSFTSPSKQQQQQPQEQVPDLTASTSDISCTSASSMPQHQHHHQLEDDDDYAAGVVLAEASNDFVDSVIRTSKICSSLLLEYCSLCTVYIDQQVQYELFSGSTTTATTSTSSSAMGDGVATKNRSQRSDSQVLWNAVTGGFVPMNVSSSSRRRASEDYNDNDDDTNNSSDRLRFHERPPSAAELDMFDEDSVVESVELRL